MFRWRMRSCPIVCDAKQCTRMRSPSKHCEFVHGADYECWRSLANILVDHIEWERLMELAGAVGANIGNSASAPGISDDFGDAPASAATAREVDWPLLSSAPGAAVEHELVLFGTVTP